MLEYVTLTPKKNTNINDEAINQSKTVENIDLNALFDEDDEDFATWVSIAVLYVYNFPYFSLYLFYFLEHIIY